MILARFIHNNIFTQSNRIRNTNIRFGSFKALQETFTNFFRTERNAGPPYNHICQIGDPVLREKAKPIDADTICTPDFQEVLEQLSSVMRCYQAFGLAVPQIGFPWQVFAIEIREETLAALDPEIVKVREIEVVPLTYFINPSLSIKDHKTVEFPEMCGSICGFQALVPRAKEIEITALDKFGKTFSLSARGWLARILQHEFDHLQGKLFIDRMDRNTFSCCIWAEVNKHGGKIKIPFYPLYR